MKYFLFISLLFVSFLSFSQNNYIVKTDDGRRVLLKADYTWEYIDMQPLTLVDSVKVVLTKKFKVNTCSIAKDFKEPELDSKIQSQLKKGRATIRYVKKKVAKDYMCNVNDVTLLSVIESKASGRYTLCANGEKVQYKRNGFKIIEKGKLF